MRNYLFDSNKKNVSLAECSVSIALGGGLLFHSLKGNKTNIPEALLSGYLLYRGITGHCLAYSALGKTKPDNRSRNINIRVSQKVNRPRHEIFEAWRNPENFPLFMQHLENVRNLSGNISEWEINIPGGIWHLKWRNEIVKEIPDTLIGWGSIEGSQIENAGKIEFKDAPDKFGTEIHAVISYHAPFGIPGEGAARMFNPYFEQLVKEDILNFKQFMENENVERLIADSSV